MFKKGDNQTNCSPSESVRETFVGELDQPERVQTILNYYGFHKVGDFCGASREECKRTLTKIRYFTCRHRQDELSLLLDQIESLGVWNNGGGND